MVLRARIMAELLDAGEGDALKRELYLCGLLSQIDLLLAEPLVSAFKGIPLPARVTAALLGRDGPYWPYLELATALESTSGQSPRTLCQHFELDAEDVNFALLRSLTSLRGFTASP
jgi:c-di-GMP-related signal transduction protein